MQPDMAQFASAHHASVWRAMLHAVIVALGFVAYVLSLHALGWAWRFKHDR